MEELQYPIGKYRIEHEITAERRAELIEQIASLPGLLRESVSGLDAEQLATAYRPEGWSVLQVVHHVADSHMNAYVRMRLALTEDEPAIAPYKEGYWAILPDALSAPVELSLSMLDGLHGRWVHLLEGMSDEQFARRFFHPQYGTRVRQDEILSHYAWHGRHHTAHVTGLRQRMGWL
ncbi:putative metal-dependent hydrolase [bacterium]|nr:putative metal-dependent hydrolase [bacterium]